MTTKKDFMIRVASKDVAVQQSLCQIYLDKCFVRNNKNIFQDN